MRNLILKLKHLWLYVEEAYEHTHEYAAGQFVIGVTGIVLAAAWLLLVPTVTTTDIETVPLLVFFLTTALLPVFRYWLINYGED